MKKATLILAFALAIAGSSLVTVLLRPSVSRADDVPNSMPPPFAEDWQISSYFAGDVGKPTNGFVVINRRTGKVSNCVANWQGQKEGKCYDWSSWVRLPR